MRMYKKPLIIITFSIFLLYVWQVVETEINTIRIESGLTGIEAFIPTPITIAKTFIEQGDVVFKQLLCTLERAFIGFLAGTMIGVGVAIIFLFFPILRVFSMPLAYSINSFPIVGFAPVIILAFGQGSSFSIVFISALICYFPVLLAIDDALQRTDKDLLDLARVMNASRYQELALIRLPMALPHLFLAMRLALPASIIGATIGEWLGTRNGIGQLITIALYQLKPGLLYTSLIAVAAVSLILVGLLSLVQTKFLKGNQAI